MNISKINIKIIMTPSLQHILSTVFMEAVYVVPKWKLIDSTSYVNAAAGMFDEVLQGWEELKTQHKYCSAPDSVLTISDCTNGNNPVYILMRKEHIRIVSNGERA